ncbi:hypothetical protein GH714_038954 [Hevea brasiliensis]|uniref:Hexosyltransferase n=1 Tax=Hevea brasiliensis TaxID=3981 RepID=A0A6A6MQR0_HEVBR|nr:hypothetical protein GH714_038954 [Hevea brasiliensis]
MAVKRGLSGAGIHKNRGGGSRLPIALVIFFSVLAPLIFFVGRGLYTNASIDQSNIPVASSKQDLDWRERLALQHVKSLLSKDVIDVITASTADMGPLSIDSFRKNNLSASWKVTGVETSVKNNTTSESQKTATVAKQEAPRGKGDGISDDHSQFIDAPAKLARRQLRDKRRAKRAADLVQQDNEAILKLENSAIERSKSVDTAVLGKYSIWRKENENENSDSTVRLMRDQMIMARVYISIAKMKNKLDLHQELQIRLKESHRAVGEAMADSDLHHR